MRGILLIHRRNSLICIIVISFWLLVYLFKVRLDNCASPIVYVNNEIYPHLGAQPSHFYTMSIDSPLHDTLLVIRTSKNTQASRMPVILNTWYKFSPNTTFITTNGNASFFHRYLSKNYHHHLHSTNCKQAHTIRDLCCNSASEFHIYFQHEHRYKWLCRFDDDQYVNVPLLINYLKRFHPDEQLLYIGKPSLKEPKHGHGIKFWFATYGGGVCFSRSLLRKIRHDVQPDDVFMNGCVSSNYPDDTHIAYILRKQYNINLTVAEDFHHHIEVNLFTNVTNASNIDQAITLGFKGSNVPRFVPLVNNDVYHMQTLHCLLYPDVNCMRLLRILLNRFYEMKNP